MKKTLILIFVLALIFAINGCRKNPSAVLPENTAAIVSPSFTPTNTATITKTPGQTLTQTPEQTATQTFTATLTGTSTATVTVTVQVDTSGYPFETAADLNGFDISSGGGNGAITSMQLGQENPYLGTGSLKLGVDFTSANTGGMLYMQGTNMQLAGKTITVHIWLPGDMFYMMNPYGVNIYVQLGNFNWYQTAFLYLTSAPTGQWNTVSGVVDDMARYDNVMLKDSGDDANTVFRWGIRVDKASALDYSGNIYIDSITVQ